MDKKKHAYQQTTFEWNELKLIPARNEKKNLLSKYIINAGGLPLTGRRRGAASSVSISNFKFLLAAISWK